MSTAIICRHGRDGFCWDDATPEQRTAFDELHRHAYEWAQAAGRDVAEEYAGHYAAIHYVEPDEAPNHPSAYERWRTTRADQRKQDST